MILRFAGRTAFKLAQLIARLVQKYDPDPPEHYDADEIICAANDNIDFNSLTNTFWQEAFNYRAIKL